MHCRATPAAGLHFVAAVSVGRLHIVALTAARAILTHTHVRTCFVAFAFQLKLLVSDKAISHASTARVWLRL